MELAVKSIVSKIRSGVIFTGETPDGLIYRVVVKEPLSLNVGETYMVEGERSEFTNRFGKAFCQINADKIERIATSGHLLAGYLTTLTGIGETRAKRLFEAFGAQVNEVLQDAERLNEIGTALQPDRPSLGCKLAAFVQAEYASKLAADHVQIEKFKFYARLEGLGVQDRGAAHKLWRLLGSSRAGDTLVANPYLAAALLPWKIADSLGMSILRSQGVENLSNHPDRLRGAVDAATRKLLSAGHTAAPEFLWLKMCPRGVPSSEMLAEGLKCGSLCREGDLIRPLGARYLEVSVSEMLASTMELPILHSVEQIETAIGATESDIGFRLTVEQRRAVGEILGRPLAVLQGGAGVGKTTVMSSVALGWEALGGNVLMAALSGKAALQLSRATSRPGKPRLAVTIARLINSLRAITEGKTVQDLPVLKQDTLLIIDEASMVDTATLHDLLVELRKLKPNGIRLLFVGDAGQLPPVGFGAVFHHLVLSNHTSQLTKPLRQSEGSVIPVIASEMRAGNIPDLPAYHRQMEGVQLIEPGKKNLVKVLASIYKHVRTYANVEEVMVCAAKNATVENFNQTIAAGNFDKAKRLSVYAKVFPGDPVICTKNHYSSGFINGVLGVVKDIEDEVLVAWDGDAQDQETGRPILRSVPPEVTLDIRLAYAITCHKSQGSATRIVIVALEDTKLLTREWLYTAVTRARQQVIIVGTREHLAKAIDRRTARITGFKLNG